VISNNQSDTTPITDKAFQQDLQAFSNTTIAGQSISGVAFQIDWKDIEPYNPNNPLVATPGPDWSRLDALFKAANASGKWVQLLIFPGFWSPEWITGTLTEKSPVGVATVPFNVQYGQQDHGKLLPLPLPWDATYLADWSAFLHLVSQRYESNPAFRMIAAAGPTSVSDEFTEPDQDSSTVHDTAKWESAGYLPATYDAAWQTMFGVYATDFPNQYVSLSVGQGVSTINADGSAVMGTPKEKAQESNANAAATRTALIAEASNKLIDFTGQFVYQSSSLTGNPAAQPSPTQSSQTSLISENGDLVTGFQLGSSAEQAPAKQGATGNPALAMALSIESGMRLNPMNGQHVDYIEVHSEDVEAADGTDPDVTPDPAMQTVLHWAASLFDPGTLSLFDQTATDPDYNITVGTDAKGDPVVTMNGESISFPPGQITSIDIYPEIYVEGSPTTTADADNTIYSTNVPVTITNIPGTTYDALPGVNLGIIGFNPSNDAVLVGNSSGPQGMSINDGVQGIDAPVTVANSSPATTLTIDDAADPADHAVKLFAAELEDLSPAPIYWNNSNINGLTIDGGSGDSTYQIDSTSAPTKVNTGNGSDSVFVVNSIQGNLSVTKGNGLNDIVHCGAASGTTTINGNLSITQGDGNIDAVVIGLSVTVGGHLSVTQGNGGGVAGSYSGDVVEVDSATVGGNLSITQGNGGAGAGGGYGDFVDLLSVTVGGNLSINQGNGGGEAGGVYGDYVGITSASVAGNLSITQGNGGGGAGSDYGDVVGIWSTTVGGKLSVTQGNGLAGSVAGDVVEIVESTVDGHMSVSQGNSGGVAGPESGDVAFFSGLIVQGNLSVTQGNGAGDFVEVVGSYGPNTFGGNLSITQGNGSSDDINFDDATVGGNASFQVGNGTGDTINIEGVSSGGSGVTFNSNVSISFGNGGDATLNIGTDGEPVSFGANASFSAGGSGNTYTVGPFVTFRPHQPTRHGI